MDNCTIEGCTARAVAKGMCRMHYMRARRHGDANTVQKRGRKVLAAKAAVKRATLDNHWSPRTFERFWLAIGILNTAKAGEKKIQQIINNASRPNGSLNVTKLTYEAAEFYCEKYPEK